MMKSIVLPRFAMRDVPRDSVVKVNSAKAQPVIGICYLLIFQMQSGKQWQAELYKDKKGNVTLLEIQPLKKTNRKGVVYESATFHHALA